MRCLRLVFLCLLLSFTPAASEAGQEAFQFKKNTELQQVKPKKPVKIKLRRSGKGEYLWELTGDDAEEIVRTDKKLRKMLNQQ